MKEWILRKNVRRIYRIFALLPKIMAATRGIFIRTLIIAVGGKCGSGLRVERGFRIRQGIHRGWDLGNRVYIGRNVTIDSMSESIFMVEDDVTLTEGIFISAIVGVEIGSKTLIGEYCSIRDANHEFSKPKTPIIEQPMRGNKIVVGKDCWLGRGTVILSGCNIGDHTVVGANSVVSKSLPANKVCFGIPAKIHSNRTTSN